MSLYFNEKHSPCWPRQSKPAGGDWVRNAGLPVITGNTLLTVACENCRRAPSDFVCPRGSRVQPRQGSESSRRARDTTATMLDHSRHRGESATKTVKFFAAHTVNCVICKNFTRIKCMLLISHQSFSRTVTNRAETLRNHFAQLTGWAVNLSCQNPKPSLKLLDYGRKIQNDVHIHTYCEPELISWRKINITVFHMRFLPPTDQKCAESSTYWQFFYYRPPVKFRFTHLGEIVKMSCQKPDIYIYYIYDALDNRYGFSISVQHGIDCTIFHSFYSWKVWKKKCFLKFSKVGRSGIGWRSG